MPQPQRPHFPLPLTRFLARLQAAGFRLDPAREWQLREILHERGSDYVGRFHELKFLLAPYLVSTATDQRRFYQLWDDWLAELESEVAAPASSPDENRGYTKERPWHYRWRRWLLAAVLAPLLLGIGLLLFEHLSEHNQEAYLQIGFNDPGGEYWREGDTLLFENWYEEEGLEGEDLRWKWEASDADTREVLRTDSAAVFDLVIPPGSGRVLRIQLTAYGPEVDPENQTYSLSRTVQCGYPPQLEQLDMPVRNIVPGKAVIYSVQSEENVLYEWTFGQEKLAGPQVQWTYKEEGTQLVSLRAARSSDPEHCFLTVEQQASIGHDRVTFPALAMIGEVPRQFRIMKGWVFLVCLLPLVLSIPLWRQWRKRRHRKALVEKTEEQLADEFPIHDAGPYNIPYADRSGQISVPSDFFRIADQLRLRESGLRRAFDGRATVEATIREGGFPAWRDRPIKRPASFLLLIEHHDEFHQQQQLLERLATFLVEREANLELYYHNGRFDHFWNDDHPTGLSPTLLAARYRESRLLIAGNAHGLVDPYETELPRLQPKAVRWLRKWNKRLLLTTEPVVDWSFQEVLLHAHLPIFPATTAGIRDGVRALNEIEDYEGGSYPRWEENQARAYPEPGHRYRQWRTVADHRDYLAGDPDLFRWLCGLAVSSTTDWNLTIATGRALGLRITHDRLLVLSRIPWLARNAWDHDLRLALLGELSDEDLTAARNTVVEELATVRSQVAGSFAQTEWTTSHAVQVFCLEPGLPANKQRIRDLRQSGWLTNDQLAELNQTVGDRSGSGPGDGQAEQLEEWLNDEGPRPWLTADLFAALFLCLLTFFCLFAVLAYEGAQHPVDGPLAIFETAENVENEARDLLNEAVNTYNDELYIERELPELVEGREAIVGEVAATLDTILEMENWKYPPARHNRMILEYNELQRPLNAYAADSITLTQLQDSAVTDDALALYAAGRELLDRWPTTRAADFGHLHGVARLYDYQYRKVSRGFSSEEEQFDSDSLDLAVLLDLERDIDSLAGGNYFDSIAPIMPVNLRTLLRNELRELARLKATFSSEPVGGEVFVEPEEEEEEEATLAEGTGRTPTEQLALPTAYTLELVPVTPEGGAATGIELLLYQGRELRQAMTVGTGPVRFAKLDPTVRYTLRATTGDLQLNYRYDERKGQLGRVTIGGLEEQTGYLEEVELQPVELFFDPTDDSPSSRRIVSDSELETAVSSYRRTIDQLRDDLSAVAAAGSGEERLREEIADLSKQESSVRARLDALYNEQKADVLQIDRLRTKLEALQQQLREKQDQLYVEYEVGGVQQQQQQQQAPPAAPPSSGEDRQSAQAARSLMTLLQRLEDQEVVAGLVAFQKEVALVSELLRADRSVNLTLTARATADDRNQENALQQAYVRWVQDYLINQIEGGKEFIDRGSLRLIIAPATASRQTLRPLSSRSSTGTASEAERAAEALLADAPNHTVRITFEIE